MNFISNLPFLYYDYRIGSQHADKEFMMFISEFAHKMNTTVDTVKYYIHLGLLTPNKKRNWYQFMDKEIEDFNQILYLKKLGLSLDSIIKIKQIHETKCGTKEQWTANHLVLLSELNKVIEEMDSLMKRKNNLVETIQQLETKINNCNE